jgi:Rhodopirellula transposase DDE domain
VYWIHLKPKEIAEQFELETGSKISNGFVKRLLQAKGFKYRKMSKNLATGTYTQRDEQFKIIFQLVSLISLNTPILSIDCKKKERLGNLYREGKLYCTDAVEVFDHDFGHLSTGIVIPHGIYDLQRNEGYVSIGMNHETAEFTKDNLLWWWDNFGIHYYPDARFILILCDAGGANSYRHFAFKKQMQILAKTINKDIIICHYPPYASKWNPIEHRLFCHMHTAMQGVVFSDYNIVKELIGKTKTENNLLVHVRLNSKHYPTGIKTNRNEIDFSKFQFNQIIPELSYRIAA